MELMSREMELWSLKKQFSFPRNNSLNEKNAADSGKYCSYTSWTILFYLAVSLFKEIIITHVYCHNAKSFPRKFQSHFQGNMNGIFHELTYTNKVNKKSWLERDLSRNYEFPDRCSRN